VGEADDGPQLLKRARDLKPAVVLLDAMLSGGVETEFEVLRDLQRKQKNLQVIALAATDRDEELMRSVRRSLAAVLPKRTAFSVLAECIRRVASGESWPDAPMTALGAGSAISLFSSTSPSLDSSPLSEREKQVVELISQGFKNKEIAERMFISEQTVKNHLHNIFDKLGVSDRLELALYAIHKNIQIAS
jgi:DNA-binding NarL/FixJ family response regulator